MWWCIYGSDIGCVPVHYVHTVHIRLIRWWRVAPLRQCRVKACRRGVNAGRPRRPAKVTRPDGPAKSKYTGRAAEARAVAGGAGREPTKQKPNADNDVMLRPRLAQVRHAFCHHATATCIEQGHGTFNPAIHASLVAARRPRAHALRIYGRRMAGLSSGVSGGSFSSHALLLAAPQTPARHRRRFCIARQAHGADGTCGVARRARAARPGRR